MSIQALPQEIIDEIFNCLMESPDWLSFEQHDRQATALLGVCSSLRRAALRHVFHDVDVSYCGDDDATCKRPSKLLAVLTPDVLRYVRSVTIRFRMPTSSQWDSHRSAHPQLPYSVSESVSTEFEGNDDDSEEEEGEDDEGEGAGEEEEGDDDDDEEETDGEDQDDTYDDASVSGDSSSAGSDHSDTVQNDPKPQQTPETPLFRALLKRLIKAPRISRLSYGGFHFDFSQANAETLYSYVFPFRLLPTLRELSIWWIDCAHVPSPFLMGDPVTDRVTAVNFDEQRGWYHRRLGPVHSIAQLKTPGLTRVTRISTDTAQSLLFYLKMCIKGGEYALPCLQELDVSMAEAPAHDALLELLQRCPGLRVLKLIDIVGEDYLDPKPLRKVLNYVGELNALEAFEFSYWDVDENVRSPLSASCRMLDSLRCPPSLKRLHISLFWSFTDEEDHNEIKGFFEPPGWDLLRLFVACLPETLEKLELRLVFHWQRTLGYELCAECQETPPFFDDEQTLKEFLIPLFELLPKRETLALKCYYEVET